MSLPTNPLADNITGNYYVQTDQNNDSFFNGSLHNSFFNGSLLNSSYPLLNETANATLNETLWEVESLAPTQFPTSEPTPEPTWAPPPTPDPNATETDQGLLESTDTAVLTGTIQVYGTVYLVLMAVFCILRKKFNRFFNIRSWVEGLECQLAKDAQEYGLVSWMWKVFQVEEDDILQQCGMDSLCFIRVLRLGRKLAIMGCFHACWLIPVYATAEDSNETWYLEDRLVIISTAHVPNGSTRFLATVICAYVTFIYCMWLMQRELQWYTSNRHTFLKQRRPRNYAIYVSGIPEELRTGTKLADFFRQSGATSSVLEAHVILACPELETLVTQRENIKASLAHAKAYEEIHGTREKRLKLSLWGLNGEPTPGSSRAMQQQPSGLVATVDSIEVLERKLRQLTKDIALAYQHIERYNDPFTLEEHRDIVMDEIEATKQAERAQNIANRERVNSGHDVANAEEIWHVEEEKIQEEKVAVNDQFSKIAEAFFFGDLSPQQRKTEQQKLIREREEEEKKKDDFRVTIHSAANEVHYLSRSEWSSDDEAETGQGNGRRRKPSRKLLHNVFPSKSTISTVPGTFENQGKWHSSTPRPGQVVMMSNIDDEACSVNSSGYIDDDDYDEVLQAISELQMQSNDKDAGSSTSSANDELKESQQSWHSKTANVIKRVGHGVQTLGGDVGKTVVGVGTGVGKVTKQVGDLGLQNVNKLGLQAAELGVGNIKTIRDSAAAVVPVVMAHEEGKALNGGFVVFKDLYSTHAALQMLHHREAGVMSVSLLKRVPLTAFPWSPKLTMRFLCSRLRKPLVRMKYSGEMLDCQAVLNEQGGC